MAFVLVVVVMALVTVYTRLVGSDRLTEDDRVSR